MSQFALNPLSQDNSRSTRQIIDSQSVCYDRIPLLLPHFSFICEERGYSGYLLTLSLLLQGQRPVPHLTSVLLNLASFLRITRPHFLCRLATSHSISKCWVCCRNWWVPWAQMAVRGHTEPLPQPPFLLDKEYLKIFGSYLPAILPS